MKFIITIPASIDMKSKKIPKLIPVQYHVTEAFNLEQAKRRVQRIDAPDSTIEPLDDWLKRIPTI